MQSLTEKTYIGSEYCFSVTQTPEGFFLAICTEEEYNSTPDPTFTFVGIYPEEEGWTFERLEEKIKDEAFVAECVKTYLSSLMLSNRIHKESQITKQEMLIDEVKQELQKAMSVNAATCWTFEEASKYSQIGINRLRKESLRKGCPWVLWVGDTKRLVKIDAFKAWLDEITFVD